MSRLADPGLLLCKCYLNFTIDYTPTYNLQRSFHDTSATSSTDRTRKICSDDMYNIDGLHYKPTRLHAW